jgi:hypothetical protein
VSRVGLAADGWFSRRRCRDIAAYYKVWVQVERIDEDADTYEDVGLPDPLGVFDTLEEAAVFIRMLPGWERNSAADSDLRVGGPLLCPECGGAPGLDETPHEEGCPCG